MYVPGLPRDSSAVLPLLWTSVALERAPVEGKTMATLETLPNATPQVVATRPKRLTDVFGTGADAPTAGHTQAVNHLIT